jgi:hypothetical protein
MTRPWILVAAACLLLTACRDEMDDDDHDITPRPQASDYVGHDALVSADLLRFTDPAEGARFHRVRDSFAQRAATDEWYAYPLRRIGNFVQQDWCRGEGAHHNCASGSFREGRGSRWFVVHTLHYESSWPEVFGLGVNAGLLPTATEGDWGTTFSWYANGGGITGSGLDASFVRFDGERIVEQIHLGDDYVYEAEEARIVVLAPGGADAELERLLESPRSLRDTAFARLDELLAAVEAEIEAGKVKRCVYGEYQNDGIPPPCFPTALTDDEKVTLLAKVRRDIGADRASVQQHFEAFHAALMGLVRFDECWEEPGGRAAGPSAPSATPP